MRVLSAVLFHALCLLLFLSIPPITTRELSRVKRQLSTGGAADAVINIPDVAQGTPPPTALPFTAPPLPPTTPPNNGGFLFGFGDFNFQDLFNFGGTGPGGGLGGFPGGFPGAGGVGGGAGGGQGAGGNGQGSTGDFGGLPASPGTSRPPFGNEGDGVSGGAFPPIGGGFPPNNNNNNNNNPFPSSGLGNGSNATFPGNRPNFPNNPIFPGNRPNFPNNPTFPGNRPFFPNNPTFPGNRPNFPNNPTFPGNRPNLPNGPIFPGNNLSFPTFPPFDLGPSGNPFPNNPGFSTLPPPTFPPLTSPTTPSPVNVCLPPAPILLGDQVANTTIPQTIQDAITQALTLDPRLSSFLDFAASLHSGGTAALPNPGTMDSDLSCPATVSRATAFERAGGRCWILQDKQEPFFYVTCRCRQCLAPRGFRQSSTSTCQPFFLPTSLFALCENRFNFQPQITREQIALPVTCRCRHSDPSVTQTPPIVGGRPGETTPPTTGGSGVVPVFPITP